MAYKFQLGTASMSGSLTQEGDIIAKSGGDASKGVVSSSLGLRLPAAATIVLPGISLSSADLLQIDGITAGTAAASKALVVDSNKDIGTIRNLTIDGVFTDGNYSFDTSGNVTGLGTVGCGAVTSTGAGSFVGTLTADTSLTLDSTTITTAEIGVLDSVSPGTAAASKALVLDASSDIAGAMRNVTMTGDMTAGTITMSGFTVDADGDTVAKTLAVPDDGLVGSATNADLLTLAAAAVTVKANSDFNVAKTAGLQLGGAAVTSTAAELNLLDTSVAGTVVNSKAAIYSNAGVLAATDLSLPNGGDLGNAAVADFMKFNAAEIVIKDGALDFDIASHDATNGLKLGGTLVSSTAAELNLVDGAGPGSVVANKAVIYNGSGIVLGQSVGIADGGSIGNSSKPQLFILSADGDATFQDGAHDFDIASHDGTNGLKLGGTLVTAPAANLNKLTGFADGTYNQAADSIVFLDADGSVMRSETNDAFLTAIAGAGLSVSGNKLVSDGGGTPSATPTHGGAVLAEGYNFLAAAVTASVIVSLPDSPTAGDVVNFKAQGGVDNANNFIEIRRQGSHLIDGETSIRVESPFGAVSMVYVAANDWRIV
jgi:hypothetical protein